jgi:SAM-dependent methyltransferase
VTFAVAADAYDRFMGRYSMPLAPRFADFAGVAAGQCALDVGCGPGALTAVLVDRLGPDEVAAVDPSEPFVDAARERHPGVDVRRAPAEELPFEDGEFDAALAQLVVHFMADPVAGLREMRRVTREDGMVAACVWDISGGNPLGVFWAAARDVDPEAPSEASRPGTREGHLAELFAAAGLSEVEDGVVSVEVEHSSFEDWWEPFTLGVGPAGGYLATLAGERRDAVRERCRELLPEAPFAITARAWAARGAA